MCRIALGDMPNDMLHGLEARFYRKRCCDLKITLTAGICASQCREGKINGPSIYGMVLRVRDKHNSVTCRCQQSTRREDILHNLRSKLAGFQAYHADGRR